MTSDRGDSGQEPRRPGRPRDATRSGWRARPTTAALASSSPDLIADSLGEYTRIWLRRVRSGESGVLPVVLGLIAIVVYFQIRSSLFLSAGNLVNLITQAAFIVTFGMAEVFVLLLGEIDLSVGYNAACGAVITLWVLSGAHPLPVVARRARRPGVLRGSTRALRASSSPGCGCRRSWSRWPAISADSACSWPSSTWPHRIQAGRSG